MSLVRFPREKYASLELNQVAFPQNGMVISQLPLSDAFTTSTPCENGMWVSADKSNAVIKPVSAATESPIGIVYTAEKEYDYAAIGLKNFGRKVEGDYPRVGILSIGDTVTTNCFQYDDTEFTSAAALETALEGWASAKLYLKPVANSPVPQLVKAANKPATGPYAVVTKYYTVPNGERAIKYEMLRV